MKERICSACGQPIPQPEGRLVCSQCGVPILRGQRWTHGGDGRPRHRDCGAARPAISQTMKLLEVNHGA